MKVKQILALLNQYLVAREYESAAKKEKEFLRDQILELLPPTATHEWVMEWWGKVTYKTPQDSIAINMEKLQQQFPKTWKACAYAKPNSPRFLVFPETEAFVEAMKGVGDDRFQTARQSNA